MREIRLFLVFFTFATLVLVGAGVEVFAQSVECKEDLNFGSIVANINGGSLSISQAGTVVGYGNKKIEARGNAGIISVLSPIAEKVNVQLSATYLSGDGNDLKVLNVTHNEANNFDLDLSANTEKYLNIGGSIQYFAGQKIGMYSGFYTITANFESSKTTVTEMCPILLNFNARDIQVSEISSLNFGTISKPAKSGGIVRILSNGTRLILSGNLQSFGSASNGEFMIEASPETTVYLSFEEGTLYNNGNKITVKNFTTNKGESISVPQNGNTSVKIGADLIIDDSQPAGEYSGNYGIIVNY